MSFTFHVSGTTGRRSSPDTRDLLTSSFEYLTESQVIRVGGRRIRRFGGWETCSNGPAETQLVAGEIGEFRWSWSFSGVPAAILAPKMVVVELQGNDTERLASF